ncbi:unnamed protein product, partial [Amoebophrya sp. A120]|eukprot:GSA120T00013326001.1
MDGEDHGVNENNYGGGLYNQNQSSTNQHALIDACWVRSAGTSTTTVSAPFAASASTGSLDERFEAEGGFLRTKLVGSGTSSTQHVGGTAGPLARTGMTNFAAQNYANKNPNKVYQG